MLEQKYLKTIRSFVRREGRMTSSQQRAYETLWPQYGLEFTEQYIELEKIFNRQSEVILEIGFGMGQSLAVQAEQNPDKDYLGIEVHKPGIGALLSAIEKKQLVNIRLFCADAVDVLNRCIEDASLTKVQIFFPDPWPKKRHHKRRLIQSGLVKLLHAKLQLGGELHLATDWQNYAEHMLTVLENATGWKNKAGKNNYLPRPSDRPLTKFEQRGQRLGHGVWDLCFLKAEPHKLFD